MNGCTDETDLRPSIKFYFLNLMGKSGLFRLNQKNYLFPFGLVCTLFFLWSLCNGMIDVMDKHFQDFLHLSKRESAWVQTAHYLGYAFMALPAGWLARKYGYKSGILLGLVLVAAGCLWFIPATHISTFWAFLLGVCIVSMGLTFLETIANPYTTVLGAPQFAAVRINIAQTFNGIGWILGPVIGGMFFYSDQGAQVAHQNLWIPYAGVAAAVIALAVVFIFAKIPDLDAPVISPSERSENPVSRSLWSHRHFIGAVIAQFFYVAAQAGIFSFFINYIVSEAPSVGLDFKDIWLLGGSSGVTPRDGGYFISEQGATKVLAFVGFTLFLAGRFIGAAILSRVSAHRILALYAGINCLLMILITGQFGWPSVTALLLSFFFMSIMFPTIFALGIHGLGRKSKLGSSFIVMAIVGGAFMPKLMGWLGDVYNMSLGFAVPCVCFAIIALYGLSWVRLSGSPGLIGIDPTRSH